MEAGNSGDRNIREQEQTGTVVRKRQRQQRGRGFRNSLTDHEGADIPLTSLAS